MAQMNENPITHIRRQDRAVTDEAWIQTFLHRAAAGTLATIFEGRPFLNTNLFAYDEAAHAIYTHTAHSGRTAHNVKADGQICFTVTEMGRLLPAKEALEFSVEYASVVVFGTAVLLDDPVEAEHGLQLLLDKYAPHLKPGQDYRPIMPDELKRTAVYRINIEQWSGKQKKVDEDFPGAYFYEDVARNA
jgi:hypothetical protein